MLFSAATTKQTLKRDKKIKQQENGKQSVQILKRTRCKCVRARGTTIRETANDEFISIPSLLLLLFQNTVREGEKEKEKPTPKCTTCPPIYFLKFQMCVCVAINNLI